MGDRRYHDYRKRAEALDRSITKLEYSQSNKSAWHALGAAFAGGGQEAERSVLNRLSALRQERFRLECDFIATLKSKPDLSHEPALHAGFASREDLEVRERITRLEAGKPDLQEITAEYGNSILGRGTGTT